MKLKHNEPFEPNRRATSEDVRHILGDIDDTLVVEILASQPSLRDLNDAALWWRGDGDLIAREHRELSASALAVVETLSRVDEGLADDAEGSGERHET
ncbi:MAG: hypothetical protein K2P58_03410 [Hyphomonadaceae bacterium]|nr:hypothetical protein [Hyphomonadaceae bacterium]